MMLEAEGLMASYGESRVLFDVSLTVAGGEVVTLLGRNGMGKTTALSVIMGILSPDSGDIRFEGHHIVGLPAFRVARHGLGFVPEGRQIFSNLTVRENLIATASRRGAEQVWTLPEVLELFPLLSPRLEIMGSLLSGGEQQMLAIGRALMTNPRLLILDEATEGLAPLVRLEIWKVLRRLKEKGQSILIVDKNIAALSRIADRHYILEKGRVVWTGGSAELQSDLELQHRYLGV
jgi:branched-chain amino acid transport system ATP-binding protein